MLRRNNEESWGLRRCLLLIVNYTEGSLGDLEVSSKKARELVLRTGRGRVLEKGTQTQRPWIHSLQETGGTGAVSNGEC